MTNAAPPSMPTKPDLGQDQDVTDSNDPNEINRRALERPRRPKPKAVRTPKPPRARRTPEEQRARDEQALERAMSRASKLKQKLDGRLTPAQVRTQVARAQVALAKLTPHFASNEQRAAVSQVRSLLAEMAVISAGATQEQTP